MKVEEEMDEEEEQEEEEEESDDEEYDEETIAAIKKAVKGKTVSSLKAKATQAKTSVKKEESENGEDIELMRVPTQHELAFKIPSGKIVSYEEYLVWLGNLIWRIKKSVA